MTTDEKPVVYDLVYTVPLIFRNNNNFIIQLCRSIRLDVMTAVDLFGKENKLNILCAEKKENSLKEKIEIEKRSSKLSGKNFDYDSFMRSERFSGIDSIVILNYLQRSPLIVPYAYIENSTLLFSYFLTKLLISIVNMSANDDD